MKRTSVLHGRGMAIVEPDPGDGAGILRRAGDLPLLGPLPMGFSMQKGLPTLAAASAIFLCRRFGAQIETTSTSG